MQGTSLVEARRARRCAARLERLRRGPERRAAGSSRREVDAPSCAREWPGLRLASDRASRPCPARARPSCASACARCRTASAARRRSRCAAQPIPHAYRVFFRHIGLEPDEHRTPVEALALERMQHGGFRSRTCSTTRSRSR